jgi:hypothetical protein
MSDLPAFLPVVVDTSIAVDAPITASKAPPAASVPADTPSPPDQLAITITLANGTRLEISAALSLPALSCIIGALR